MMSRQILILSLILTLTGINSFATDITAGPKLGRAASAAEIARWDINVMPDGKGLPEGQGSALEGESVYTKQCLSCHGPKGEGASADQLAFAKKALTSDWPEKTIGSYWPYATTLFDFNRRAMPMQAPGSLTDDDNYAVTAYLLYLNGIIAENEVMDAKSLAKVRMPNRFGFINVYEQEKNTR